MNKKAISVYFILVNYNNSKITIDCIDSIFAQKKIPVSVDVKIIVVDNASTEAEIEVLKIWERDNCNKDIRILYSVVNLGYFGAFNYAFKTIENINKIVVIANNDLAFDQFFVCNLFEKDYSFTTWVLSPDIVTPLGIHQNPHVINRISLVRRFFYRIYFLNYVLAYCISMLSKLLGYSRQSTSKVGYNKEQFINMGFGACFVLLPRFFLQFKYLDDRVFLMGEEALLSNQIHSCGGEILYTPFLKVIHMDHSTFKKFPAKKNYEITRKSYMIYKKYL